MKRLIGAAAALDQEVTHMVKASGESVRPDSVGIEFDDERLIADAGLALITTLSRRLGIESLVDETARRGERPGAARPGRKVATLLHAIAAGADSIDDADMLRSGGTEAVLGHRAMAPSTLGTFLRAFTFGHVRQLDRVLAEAIRRAWATGAGPGKERLVIDVDSFLGEAKGAKKQGASRGYTGVRGYHPLLATRAGTGEVLHARARKGSAGSGRGALRFCGELIARGRRAGGGGRRRGPDPRRLGLLLGQADLLPGGQALPLLDLRHPAQAHGGADRRGPRVGLATGPRLSRDRRLRTRRDHLRRPATGGPPRPPARPGGPGGALCLLAPLRLPHQSRRGHAHRRRRAPPARRGRARDPRPEGPGARPLPLRALRRQRRLDGDRLPRPQPSALDRSAGAREGVLARGTDAPPPADRAAGPAPPHRPALDAAPARPLALARCLRRGARADQGAAGSGLTFVQPDHFARPPGPPRAAHPRSPDTGGSPSDPSPSPDAPSGRRFSPPGRSPTTIRRPVRMDRWIEAKIVPCGPPQGTICPPG